MKLRVAVPWICLSVGILIAVLIFGAGRWSRGKQAAIREQKTPVMLTIAEAEAAWRVLESVRKEEREAMDEAKDQRLRDAEFVWHRAGARVSGFRGDEFGKYKAYEGYEKDQIDAFLQRKWVRQHIDNDRSEVRRATVDAERLQWSSTLSALMKTAGQLDTEWNEAWTTWRASR